MRGLCSCGNRERRTRKVIVKLEDIGFYTLNDTRARAASFTSPLMRCELIITDKCNFKCPYCRGLRSDLKGAISKEDGIAIIDMWTSQGLENIRFSGGEPTLHSSLGYFVSRAKESGVERIAVSTNGTATPEKYKELVSLGVNDFSISLDACCASTAEVMSGGIKTWDRVTENIRMLSGLTYTTVGVVITEDNLSEIERTMEFAASLSVSDIRIIPSAQYGSRIGKNLPHMTNPKYPILAYRMKNLSMGLALRGISDDSCHKCGLALDDMAVAGGYHFPCIIYMREGGNPIGKMEEGFREKRLEWYKNHDTHTDPICKGNCLDVCVAYNNTFQSFVDNGEKMI